MQIWLLRSPLVTLTTYLWVREDPAVCVFHHVSLTYCLSGPSVSEAGCTWQASRALPVPLGQLCRRIWRFTHLLGAELTRNGGSLNVLAFSTLPAGNRKDKCWNFTVSGTSKSILFCFGKTRILLLAEAKIIALKQSDAVIYNVHFIYTYMRCR